MSIFPRANDVELLLSLLNTRIALEFLEILSPTLNFEAGQIGAIPVIKPSIDLRIVCEAAIGLARTDWENFETSWDFRDLPLLREGTKGMTLAESWQTWEAQSTSVVHRLQELETENNRIFIAAYGLDGELRPEVPEEQITLFCNSANRYKRKRKHKVEQADAESFDDSIEIVEEALAYSPEERSRLFRVDTVREFLSYAVGCMMGRYSLDKPGLILANAGDTVAQYLEKVGLSQEQLRFAPDDDGILPVLDGEWFADDVVTRTREFLRVTFGEESLSENLRFIEESLGKDLRQYFLTDFYKNHLQTYKRRPIYWMFCSGKQRAFQCLVYLHRYHEGTLSRLRTEYVIALQSRMAARIEQLETDKTQATSTSHRKKLQKEQDDLKKQQTELLAFDEKLKHLADRRIKLDLDDGVKVNYGKFGELLAEVKAVTGGSDE